MGGEVRCMQRGLDQPKPTQQSIRKSHLRAHTHTHTHNSYSSTGMYVCACTFALGLGQERAAPRPASNAPNLPRKGDARVPNVPRERLCAYIVCVAPGGCLLSFSALSLGNSCASLVVIASGAKELAAEPGHHHNNNNHHVAIAAATAPGAGSPS